MCGFTVCTHITNLYWTLCMLYYVKFCEIREFRELCEILWNVKFFTNFTKCLISRKKNFFVKNFFFVNFVNFVKFCEMWNFFHVWLFLTLGCTEKYVWFFLTLSCKEDYIWHVCSFTVRTHITNLYQSRTNLGPDFRNEILNFTFFSVIFDKNPFQTIIWTYFRKIDMNGEFGSKIWSLYK